MPSETDISKYSAEEQEWLRRNQNPNGSYDTQRLNERNNYTGDRPFDSQGPMYDQRTNGLSAQGQAAIAARPSLGSLLGLTARAPNIAYQDPQRITYQPVNPMPVLKPAGTQGQPVPMQPSGGGGDGIQWGPSGPPPPGSTPTNAGINPLAVAYIGPDGRRYTGMRGGSLVGQTQTLGDLTGLSPQARY